MGIGASVFLLAAGAIITFALDVRVGWLDLDVVGWVLMACGRRPDLYRQHHEPASPDGQHHRRTGRRPARGRGRPRVRREPATVDTPLDNDSGRHLIGRGLPPRPMSVSDGGRCGTGRPGRWPGSGPRPGPGAPRRRPGRPGGVHEHGGHLEEPLQRTLPDPHALDPAVGHDHESTGQQSVAGDQRRGGQLVTQDELTQRRQPAGPAAGSAGPRPIAARSPATPGPARVRPSARCPPAAANHRLRSAGRGGRR